MSHSFAESEHRSLALVASELTWMTTLLLDLQIKVDSALVLCDSQVAIHIASNPTYHERTKHIEVDCHFIREKVNKGTIKLVHVRTQH